MSDKILEARGHTTREGVLNLSLDVGLSDADVVVRVQVQGTAPVEVDANGWPRGFFENVAGSMPELRRPSQGTFEQRLSLD